MADTMLVQGRYRLLDLVGRGGMGEVWRAHDEALGRPVAVKRFKPVGPRSDPAAMRVLRERFRREARVAAALQHPGVTVVHDFGEHEGVLHLVMELLDGQDLSRLLKQRQRRPLPAGEVAGIAEQVAAALGYTHDQGVVHRDLKPANIVRLSDGTVKICDFGIARLTGDGGFTARTSGGQAVMGTPHYMSPEQISGEAVDHRSDLYSLGCVLYEIATGAPPFDLGDPYAVLLGHRDTPPEPPGARVPGLPGHLERLILDLLAKRPEDRPGDAAELVRRLAAEGGQHSGTVPPPRRWAEPPLPGWAGGMGAGCAVGGARPTGPHHGPHDRSAPLTTAWTGAPGPVRTPDAHRPGTPAAHLETVRSLARRGHWPQALAEARAAAAQGERLLGPDHPATLACRREEAVALGGLGLWADALEICHGVVATRTRVLGPAHPDTLLSREDEVRCLEQLGRGAEAAALCRRDAPYPG